MGHLCIGIDIAARCEVDLYLLLARFKALTVTADIPDKNFCVLQVQITCHGAFFIAFSTSIAQFSDLQENKQTIKIINT